jgi:hypothetical protein
MLLLLNGLCSSAGHAGIGKHETARAHTMCLGLFLQVADVAINGASKRRLIQRITGGRKTSGSRTAVVLALRAANLE